jgi:hypothetical protein
MGIRILEGLVYSLSEGWSLLQAGNRRRKQHKYTSH